MAESAFQISTPEAQDELKREIQWEEEPTHSKQYGKKSKAPNATSSATAHLMRVDAPDFEWPAPWEQVWSRGAVPSPSAAHYLIERTNKLWESELVCNVALHHIFVPRFAPLFMCSFAFPTCVHPEPIRRACDRFGWAPEQAYALPCLASLR
jgi:hypothetical protein